MFINQTGPGVLPHWYLTSPEPPDEITQDSVREWVAGLQSSFFPPGFPPGSKRNWVVDVGELRVFENVGNVFEPSWSPRPLSQLAAHFPEAAPYLLAYCGQLATTAERLLAAGGDWSRVARPWRSGSDTVVDVPSAIGSLRREVAETANQMSVAEGTAGVRFQSPVVMSARAHLVASPLPLMMELPDDKGGVVRIPADAVRYVIEGCDGSDVRVVYDNEYTDGSPRIGDVDVAASILDVIGRIHQAGVSFLVIGVGDDAGSARPAGVAPAHIAAVGDSGTRRNLHWFGNNILDSLADIAQALALVGGTTAPFYNPGPPDMENTPVGFIDVRAVRSLPFAAPGQRVYAHVATKRPYYRDVEETLQALVVDRDAVVEALVASGIPFATGGEGTITVAPPPVGRQRPQPVLGQVTGDTPTGKLPAIGVQKQLSAGGDGLTRGRDNALGG